MEISKKVRQFKFKTYEGYKDSEFQKYVYDRIDEKNIEALKALHLARRNLPQYVMDFMKKYALEKMPEKKLEFGQMFVTINYRRSFKSKLIAAHKGIEKILWGNVYCG